jgi:hypothetical protein
MATTFTWNIAQMERTVADGIVHTVHYTVDAKDDTYSAGAYGSIGLEPPAPDDTIPFNALFPELCVEWVKHKLTGEKVAEIEAALQQQIDEQRSPSVATGLPWAAAPAAA